MRALGVIGTAAMLWVGGGIVVHGADEYRLTPIPHLLHDAAESAGHALPAAQGAVTWLVAAMGSAAVGLVIGAAVIALLKLISQMRGKAPAH
jgi:hypothetical protein